MNIASKPITAAAFIAALLALASSVLVFLELGRLERSIAAALPDEATETQQALPTDAGDLTPPEADLQRAIQQLQAEIAAIRAGQQVSAVSPVPPRPAAPPADNDSADVGPEIPAYTEPPVIQRFAEEWGQSDWGAAATDAVETAAVDHPFFGDIGGAVVSDCRQTTCQVEWLAPAFEEVGEDERDRLLGQARYEMLALAARSVDDLGPMAVNWRGGDNGPVLTVTFEQIAGQTR